VAVVSGLAPAAPAGAAPRGVRVRQKDFAYSPAAVTVKAGTKVTWTYDEVPSDLQGCESPVLQTAPGVNCPGHSVTAVDRGRNGKPLFDSGLHRASGFPFSVTFARPGTYRYYCLVHGGPHPNTPVTHMDGVVTVTR
jgi:plastocyanin